MINWTRLRIDSSLGNKEEPIDFARKKSFYLALKKKDFKGFKVQKKTFIEWWCPRHQRLRNRGGLIYKIKILWTKSGIVDPRNILEILQDGNNFVSAISSQLKKNTNLLPREISTPSEKNNLIPNWEPL